MSLNGGTRLLTRAEIDAMDDVPWEEIVIPEWKGRKVRVQGMTVGQRNAWEASNTHRVRRADGILSQEVKLDAMTTYRQRLVAHCLVDENGNRLYSNADIPALEKKSAAAIERIINVANRLNGLTQRELDELEKNSQSTDADVESSDLQPSSDEQSAN